MSLPRRRAPSRMRKDAPWAARAAVALAMVFAVVFTAAFILDGRGTPKPGLSAPPSAAEFSAFHMAESINTDDAWNTFLRNYHRGELVNVARDRLEKLKARPLKRRQRPTSRCTVAKPAELCRAVKRAGLESEMVGICRHDPDPGRRFYDGQ